MHVRISALVASITLLICGVSSAGAAAHPRHHHPKPKHHKALRLPADYEAWSKVADCESNSHWQIFGSVYPDPLGITAANWRIYGGGFPEPPTWSASVAERIRAIGVGDRLLRAVEGPHYRIPDQYGCQPGGW